MININKYNDWNIYGDLNVPTSKEEFLIGLADRLKISDIYGLMKTWESMSKSKNAIELLIQSDELTIQEKVYIAIDLGLEICQHLEK